MGTVECRKTSESCSVKDTTRETFLSQLLDRETTVFKKEGSRTSKRFTSF